VADNQIFVTKPSMPPLEEFMPYLERIWKSGQVTNNGPYHEELEKALCEHLGVKYISLFTNATIALITALKVLDISGEVITTPYSFVATAHSLLWNNLTPVFIDVDPNNCNLNPSKIESEITPRTSAIMPVHCYGNPCDVEKIDAIAKSNGLKVIYDAAHAFGVKYRGESLLNHGDLSVLSFHATKVFNTFEGGAIVCDDIETKQKIDFLKNFGIENQLSVIATGINGKMSEFNAAFGLLQLKYIQDEIALRKELAHFYRQALSDVKGISLLPKQPSYVLENSSYFPIFVNRDYPLSRDDLFLKLKDAGINGRRYFYPLISNLSMYNTMPSASKNTLPVANQIADEVICLPLYSTLSIEQVKSIVQVIESEST